MIVGSAGPVLVDFGFTRAAREPVDDDGRHAGVRAARGGVRGEHSTASDRYSFGATAYFMITGQLPTPTDRRAMAERIVHSAGAEGRSDIADHVLSMMDPDPARAPGEHGRMGPAVGRQGRLRRRSVDRVHHAGVAGAARCAAGAGAADATGAAGAIDHVGRVRPTGGRHDGAPPALADDGHLEPERAVVATAAAHDVVPDGRIGADFHAQGPQEVAPSRSWHS